MRRSRAHDRISTSRAVAPRRIVLLAVAMLLLALPASAMASSIGAVGINDIRSDGILLPNAAWNGPADLSLASGAGVQLYRARLQLNCVDPGHTGHFNFTAPSATCYGLSYDALVGALAQRGMTLLPVLINLNGATPLPPTPSGAAGTPTTAEFAAFAAAAAARYGPTGSYWSTCGCTPHPVQAWEIWNEENNGWWWNGSVSASAYAALFAATRAALRSVDPQARAVVGGLAFDANGEASFISPQQMIQTLAAGNANAFDAVAVHPYTDATGASGSQMANDAMALISSVARQLVASTGPGPGGAPRQQIWITEMGWSNQSDSASSVGTGLADFFALLDGGARAADNVGPVLWYDLRDNATLASRDDMIGLRYTAANGADAGAKPVWGAFASAAQHEGSVTLPAVLSDSGPFAGAGSGSSAPPSSTPSGAHATPEPVSARVGVASAFSASISRVRPSSAKTTRLVCHTVVKHGKRQRLCKREAVRQVSHKTVKQPAKATTRRS